MPSIEEIVVGFQELYAKHVIKKIEGGGQGEWGGRRRKMMSETTRRPNAIKERHTHTYTCFCVNKRETQA